jgi:hypothetical protein
MAGIDLFLEFDYVFGIAVIAVFVLMILFYIVYPYDKEI